MDAESEPRIGAVLTQPGRPAARYRFIFP